MKKAKRVYVAGLLTPRGVWNKNPAIDYLLNVRNMVRVGVEIMLAGFVPYIPALDYTMFLELRGDEVITEKMIKDLSLSWMEVCDYLFLTEGWEGSPGTINELKRSKELGMPSFTNIDEMKLYDTFPHTRKVRSYYSVPDRKQVNIHLPKPIRRK